MNTLHFALALEGEGMDPKHASIIAHELYALYAHSVLGGKYKEVDYGDFDALSAKARKVREDKQATEDGLRKLLAEMEEDRKTHDATWRQEREAREAEQAATQESIRETNAYLKVRLELSKEEKRLDFVLEHGLPMERDGQFRYHGWANLGWFKSQREAIDQAIRYPGEGE